MARLAGRGKLAPPGCISHRLDGTGADVNQTIETGRLKITHVSKSKLHDNGGRMIDESVDSYSHSILPGGFEVMS